MYSCTLFRIYPSNQYYARDLQTIFSSPMSKKLYQHVYKFSNRIITSGPNNVRSKTGAVDMFTPSQEADAIECLVQSLTSYLIRFIVEPLPFWQLLLTISSDCQEDSDSSIKDQQF